MYKCGNNVQMFVVFRTQISNIQKKIFFLFKFESNLFKIDMNLYFRFGDSSFKNVLDISW